ncbi:hypothetical protein JW935_11740 [candidate division KSB1 bacterium]|nr:hypothetical protein [candidate division KSB1 bacterium]
MKRICFLIYVLVHSTIVSAVTLRQQIENDVASDKISQVQGYYYRLLSVYHPDMMPEQYKTLIPQVSRHTTALKALVKQQWSSFTSDEQKLLSEFYTRPSENLPLSVVSPTGLFRVHYTDKGTNAAKEEYVRFVAVIFDEVYDFEINTLGYLPPPSDFNVDGPEYDIYIQNWGDYGASTYDMPANDPARPYGYSSFVEMDNDFTHTPTKGYDAVRVTAAHEFFHMIQIGYRSYHVSDIGSVFMFEASATWMEDVVYDYVNDYYNYLENFIRNYSDPYGDHPIHKTDYSSEYGFSLFLFMLEKKYGRRAIRNFWTAFAHLDVFPALESTLNEFGSNMATELAEFSLWNFFTGSRADTSVYYPEGQNYPMVEAKETQEFNNSVVLTGRQTLLSSKFYKLVPQVSGDYAVSPVFGAPFDWAFIMIVTDGDSIGRSVVSKGNISHNLSDIRSLSEIWIAPTFVRMPESDFDLTRSDFQFTVQLGKAPRLESRIVDAVPNPFLPSSCRNLALRFQLAQHQSDVYITIVNELGVKIARYYLGHLPDGMNQFKWDGRNEQGDQVVSGIYMFYIEAGGMIGTGKFALIR